jgi:ribosomal protein S18 acetylase RimI-like enzyme
MTPDITIRPAKPADSGLVSRLIYLTMGIEADWLFGRRKGVSTLDVIADLFRRRGNRMSFNLACLAERGGQVAGLLLAYPGRLLARLNWMTGWHMLRGFGLAATIHLIRIQSAYNDLKETEADEYYISNLAVFPAFQGQGIGSLLMAHADDKADESGLQKCSLIVAFGHENARHLYEQLGYKVVRSHLSDHPKVAEGSGGYHRMVKTLAPQPEIARETG